MTDFLTTLLTSALPQWALLIVAVAIGAVLIWRELRDAQQDQAALYRTAVETAQQALAICRSESTTMHDQLTAVLARVEELEAALDTSQTEFAVLQSRLRSLEEENARLRQLLQGKGYDI